MRHLPGFLATVSNLRGFSRPLWTFVHYFLPTRNSEEPEIIRQGYGGAYLKYPFDPARMEEFRAAEREAREHQRGLWGSVPGTFPTRPPA